MKKVDILGIILCEIQGELFEKYKSFSNMSPYFFIPRFMHSDLAKRFDDTMILFESSTVESLNNELENQYGKSSFGSNTSVNSEALYWTGYVYRYISYAYDFPSWRLVQILPPKELINRWYIYHTFDVELAIEKISEELKIDFNDTRSEGEKLEELLNQFTKEIQSKISKK